MILGGIFGDFLSWQFGHSSILDMSFSKILLEPFLDIFWALFKVLNCHPTQEEEEGQQVREEGGRGQKGE